MAEEKITKFIGKHRFLSNFYSSKITCSYPPVIGGGDEYVFETVEHAYQSAKAADQGAARAIRETSTPGDAKRMGRRIRVREEWDGIKLEVMEYFLKLKFAPESELARMLLATGDAYLAEGNEWGDTYWGVCRGKGENYLGRLLMKRRDELGSSSARPRCGRDVPKSWKW